MVNHLKNFTCVLVLILFTMTFEVFANVRCPLTAEQIDLRIDFVTKYQESLIPGRNAFERHYQENLADLKAMEKAHLASDICAGISAAATLYVGSFAMAGAISTGSITFLGTSYTTHSLIGAGFLGYKGLSVSKATYDLASMTFGFFEDSPQEIYSSQVRSIKNQGLLTSKVKGFVIDPDWSGYSTDLEHPAFELAFDRLEDFRSTQFKEIGNSRSFWGYVGEFWHERGLKTSALETAVFNEARNIQEQRIIYLDIILNLLKHQKEICY